MNEELRPTFLNPEGMAHAAITQPDIAERRACGIGVNVASLFTLFIEMCLLRKFGSRYFKILILLLGVLLFPTVCLFSASIGAATSGGKSSVVALGIFWLLFTYHGIRIGRLIANEELEIDSELDNESWPVFNTRVWLLRRGVYEPLAVLAVVVTLYGLGLLNAMLALFFIIGAFALSLKCLLYWWDAWTFRRVHRDMKNRMPRMEQLATGTTPKDAMPQVMRHKVTSA